MTGNRIKNITVSNLWGEDKMQWDPLNPDVNILVGINGSGKSTLLRIISAVLSGDDETLEKYGEQLDVIIEFDKGQIAYSRSSRSSVIGNASKAFLLSTFDTPIRDRERLKKNESSLDQELDFLIYQREKDDPVNFTNYRLKATMPKYNSAEIANNIERFFSKIINPLFAGTEKQIEIDESTNELVFRKKNNIIKLIDLSSGEKQMLIILFRLFLMDYEPYIVLMDEPEVSLHIEWQQKLIDVMKNVNPNCQFIISTHSPSIFGKGWLDKLQQMENLKT